MTMLDPFPYGLTRVGIIMSPEEGNELEVEGVLNPASARGADGQLYLFPRLVAAGNVSRVGIARVVIQDGVPVGVEREGVVLEPDRGWERGAEHAGVEDPRITFIPRLGLHVMTYVGVWPPRAAIGHRDLTRSARMAAPRSRALRVRRQPRH